MKKVSLTAVVLALATASAWAHEGHEHFKRADACFAKAGESPSSFHATNTMVLKHSLHDATQKQREEMCVYADKHFGDIARKLKCE